MNSLRLLCHASDPEIAGCAAWPLGALLGAHSAWPHQTFAQCRLEQPSKDLWSGWDPEHSWVFHTYAACHMSQGLQSDIVLFRFALASAGIACGAMQTTYASMCTAGVIRIACLQRLLQFCRCRHCFCKPGQSCAEPLLLRLWLFASQSEDHAHDLHPAA